MTGWRFGKTLGLVLCCIVADSAGTKALEGGRPSRDPDGFRSFVVRVWTPWPCTGVAISRRLALTAGHCTFDEGPYKVTALDADFKESFSATAQVTTHPGYDDAASLSTERGVKNDIGIVFLDTDFPDWIHPVPVAASFWQTTARLQAAGFGNDAKGKDGILRERSVVVAHRWWEFPSMLRLSDSRSVRKTEPQIFCQGDSGTPVMEKIDDKNVLVGIVVIGSRCQTPRHDGDYYATPVGSYRRFIEDEAKKRGETIMFVSNDR